MPALSQMSSVSSFGTSLIALQFDLDRNIDAAEQDVQAAINAAATFLPPTLPTPPVYAKTNPADTPILTLAAMSKTLRLPEVDDVADSILAQKIAQVPGVGLVSINGSQKPAVRIQVDPAALAGVGLSLEDVRGALALANVNQPKGNIDGPRLNFTIASNDQLLKAARFAPLVLAVRNDAPVRLSDVGVAVDGVENALLAGWANDRRAIILNVWRQPGANVIATADRVKALLPRLRQALPRSLEVALLNDRTGTVRASVRDVQETLLLTVLLVVAVNFLFLGSLRAMLIPGVAVPLSLIATFGVMYLVDYSLDNLSLMALTISTGFVVDDAIVMVENVSRYVEAGEAPLEAALKGSKQIGFTIVSLTISLVAVLIPLLFMGGLIGRLFREFAVTLSIAIAASALLSLTLTAMMSAHLLHARSSGGQGRFGRWSESLASRLTGFYRRTLEWVLAHQLLTLLTTIATLGLTLLLAFFIPKGFFPLEDTGLIQGVSEASPRTSFARMMTLQSALAEVVRRDPDVANVTSFIGADGTNATPNSGRLLIALAPRSRRKASAAQIIARLRPRLAKVTGIALSLQAVQDLQIDARVSRTQFQFTLDDANGDELRAWTPRAVAKLRTLPELRDVASDQQQKGLQLELTVDRDAAYRLGLSAQAIDDTLYDAFGQRIVSTIFTQLNQYRVILEVKPEDQRSPDALSRIFVRGPTGDQVPLSAFARFRVAEAPIAVEHQGQFPAVTVSFDLAPGASFGAGGGGHRARPARGRPAARHPHHLRRRGAGLPLVADERALSDPGGAARRLHRSRRLIRELHPPHHDPLHAAVGGRGRAVGADAPAHRLQHHRAHRGDPPHRHRQEERDHDDRLRPAGRARRRQVPARGHLPGLPATPAPDHDDDHGGAARRRAAGLQPGHRVGAAPAARHHDHRRPAHLAAADAVHDPGHLSLHGAARSPAAAQAAAAGAAAGLGGAA